MLQRPVISCFALVAFVLGCMPEFQSGVPKEMDLPAGFLERPLPLGFDHPSPARTGTGGDSFEVTASEGREPSVQEDPAHLLELGALVEEAASDPPLDPDQVLVSTSVETPVYSGPSFTATKLGYLRSGAVVARQAEAAGHEGCKAGFYEIAPRGFVCVGRAASLDIGHPLTQVARVRPARALGLPYIYARSGNQVAQRYHRIPTPAEQEQVEGNGARRSLPEEWRGEISPVPWFLQEHRNSVRPNGEQRVAPGVSAGRSIRDAGFAFLELFEAGGRHFGLTTDFDVMPLDRLKRVTPSDFRGVLLGDGTELPLAFVRAQNAFLYTGDPQRGLVVLRPVGFREGFSLTGVKERIGGRTYLETHDGYWLQDTERLVLIEPMQKVPGWATPGRPWIDVSILKQTLVAYEGTKAVYATLVSTGVDGLGDPETTHSTVRGQFLIHTKHVSTQMAGDEEGDEFDLRDVPYVQYFKEGYALHGAYWHDRFGTPRSHGCINLSPQDAQWLFEWTDPHVPPAWHGAMSLREGTLVSIHP